MEMVQTVGKDVAVLVAFAVLAVIWRLLAKVLATQVERIKDVQVRDTVKRIVLEVETIGARKGWDGVQKKSEAVAKLNAEGMGWAVGLIDVVVAELDAYLTKVTTKIAGVVS